MRRALTLLLATAALAYVALFVVLACLRAPYPFELEWMEGGMLEHALRVRAGLPIYVEPDLEFGAFPYPPLYAYAGALSMAFFGQGFLALRCVSILATLALFAALFGYARREGGSALSGVLSVGLFAACYRFSGAWYDVARVDMLSWALALASLYVLRSRAGPAAATASGALAFLAFFAKQTALGLGVGLAVAAFARGRREGFAFSLTLAVLVGGSTLAYDLASDGWYTWYVFELLPGHELMGSAALGFWRELGIGLGPALLSVAFGTAAARSSGTTPFSGVSWIAALALALSAWVGRAHEGGYDNTLVPACLAVALLFGPAVARMLGRGGAPSVAAALLALAQLALLAYDPRAQLPTAADRLEGERVVAELAAVDGDVFVPYQSYLARRAGKRPCIHYMAIEDLLKAVAAEPGSDRHARGQRFVDHLTSAIDSRRYGALVMAEDRADLAPLFLREYRAPRPLVDPEHPELFAPITGWPARPRWIYLQK